VIVAVSMCLPSLNFFKNRGDHTSADMSWRRVSSDAELKKKVVVQHDDVYDLSWSPGGNLLAAGSVNHITCVWDVERRAIVTQVKADPHPRRAHPVQK